MAIDSLNLETRKVTSILSSVNVTLQISVLWLTWFAKGHLQPKPSTEESLVSCCAYFYKYTYLHK